MNAQTPLVRDPLRILLTAAEAYPALEQAFLSAEREIWGSFLVFDPRTRLRSLEARAIGRTWFDLIVHTLNRGVALHLWISDVDPVGRGQMHRDAARAVRMLNAAGAVAKPGARLQVTLARHPAETGWGVRLAIWPYILKKLSRQARWLNGLGDGERAAALRDMPGAVQNLVVRKDGRVRPRLWPIARLFPVVHHQKMAVFDRRRLYVGGLDLDERRYDDPDHQRAGDETWHDVQVMIDGPAADEAQRHLESFAGIVAGRSSVGTPGRHLLRTLSRQHRAAPFAFGPEPLVQEIREAHRVRVARAEQLIYLESQYFRDQKLARRLAAKARTNRDLSMILILPARPDEVAFDGKRGLDSRFGEALQARALRILRRGFGRRLFVGSPAQKRWAAPRTGDAEGDPSTLHDAPLVYVHAKVSIFDDATAIISSANLNGRSLAWDTESGVAIDDARQVAELRRRVMAHWLPKDAGADAFDPATAVKVWGRIARANARLEPPKRRGFLLPHDFAAAEAFGRPLPIVPEEMA
jgi:hypothetical protein